MIEELEAELDAWRARGLERQLRSMTSVQGPRCVIDGREVVNFSSNDYLSLAAHPWLKRAACEAAAHFGVGSGASRLIVGNQAPHEDLEAALAAFHRRPAALLFNSGFNANVGVLQAVVGAGDLIFSDELNHASIIDGSRLSRAEVVVYPHRDLEALDRALSIRRGRRRLIVSDTVFSMDGDLAEVAGLRALADRHGAWLMLDEAHAGGCLGPGGRGVAAAAGVSADIHVGTLSKAFGCHGGYVAGPAALIQVLLQRARSFVFTTAMPALVAAAAVQAVDLVSGEEGVSRRQQLGARIAQLRDGLRARGLCASGAGDSPIFPLVLGDEARTMEGTARLLARGLLVQGIRPPTVPDKTSRLRIALAAGHCEAEIEGLLEGLDELLAAGLLRRGDA